MPRMPRISILPSRLDSTERSWMPRFCATAAMPAVRQLARPTSTYSIGVERELGLVFLILAEPEKVLQLRLAVRAVLPFAGGAPFELGGFRCALQCLPRGQQCIHVHAVVDECSSHLFPLRYRVQPEARSLRPKACVRTALPKFRIIHPSAADAR